MEHIQELIDKFWRGEASRQERHELLDYLQHHEEELKRFLEHSYLNMQEEELHQLIEHTKAGDLLKEIHETAGIGVGVPDDRMSSWWPAIRIAAAAVVIAALGFVLMQYRNGQPVKQQRLIASENIVPASIVKTNTDTTEMHILLPDQSLVSLSPRSTVTYGQDYGLATRDIFLEGKARFSVAADKSKPFTVYANSYATTALGTEFIVSTRTIGETRVKLLSGKVVVRAMAESSFAIADTYLNPGDELQIRSLDGQLALKHGQHTLPDAVKGGPGMYDVQVPPSSFLHFDRTPLANVFSEVAVKLNVAIVTESADLGGLSFTGDFEEDDSLETILSIVCNMNDLMYAYENDRVVISNK